MPRTDTPRAGRAQLAVWLILGLALALRLWKLSDKNLWLDESVSWQFATSPLADLIRGTAGDIHPPLYYILLKGWVRLFGDTLAGLRSLSVAWSMIAAYLMLRLAGRDLPRVVACAALVGFAVSPHAVLFSQEARMYAAVTACVLGACLAYRRWVDSDFTSRLALTGYAASVTLCVYLHYFTALALAAIWLHSLLLMLGVMRTSTPAPRRLPWLSWVLVHGAILICYIPWIAIATGQITHGQSWRQPVTVAQLPHYFRDTLAGLIGGVSWYSFNSAPAIIAVSVFGLGLALLLAAAIRRRDREREMFFVLLALVPLVLGLALLPFSGHMDLARYLPYALPLILLAAARGLYAARVAPVIAAVVLVIGSLAMVPALRTYYDTSTKDSDARPIVAYLGQAPPGSSGTVVVAPGYMEPVLQYISRQTLVYRPIDSADALASLLSAPASSSNPTWLVVDYRWAGFADLGRDARLEEVMVPSGRPEMIKLFRVKQ